MYINKQNIIIWTILILLFPSCIKDELYNKSGSNIDNFNLLWNTIDESYCYFDYKNINWDSVKTVYKPRVSNTMSKYDFFNVCKEMLQELKDGHVNLISDFNVMTYKDFFFDYPSNYNNTIVERNYLGKDFIYSNWIKAKKHKNIGYLRYSSFMDIISTKNIKEALIQLGSIDGLIIDVRDNQGGALSMVDTIVSNFCQVETIVGYLRYKEGSGHNDFSNYYAKKIKPISHVSFSGNIVILTNRKVFSAANEFVSAMSCLKNVTVIGDKTGGGGGAPFSSELYNGWQVLNSRNPLFDKDKRQIEFGIEPDIHVDMNKDDEYNGIDSIIEYAINYLSNLNK